MNYMEYHTKVKNYLKDNEYEEVATFYADGIVCEEEFRKKDCRPLFILKEVHEEESESEFYNFLESPDIREGKEVTWRKLITLARGIINGNSDDEYKLITANDTEIYNEYVKKVAIINLKKIAGGKYCGDKKSLSTLHFSEHAKIFQNELREQIRDIKPTIVVCCGKDVYDCVKRYNLVEIGRAHV